MYGDPHLGHARSAVVYDTVFRYLQTLGYRVRYVRNITDVGHLENEVDESGEDKVSKKAKAEQLEPMEVVQTLPTATAMPCGNSISFLPALNRLLVATSPNR